MADPRGEDFLSRWSRRKRDAARRDADDIEKDANLNQAEEEPSAEVVDEEAEANRRAAEAVDIDALSKGDDFSVFLKRGVPATLRNRALRKLWRTNPTLANLDGLNDYDTDFSDTTQNVYNSLWQVGRGYVNRAEVETQNAPDDVHDTQATESAERIAKPEGDAPELASAEEERDVTSQAPPPETGSGEDGKIQTPPQEAGNEEEERRPRRVSIRRRLGS